MLNIYKFFLCGPVPVLKHTLSPLLPDWWFLSGPSAALPGRAVCCSGLYQTPADHWGPGPSLCWNPLGWTPEWSKEPEPEEPPLCPTTMTVQLSSVDVIFSVPGSPPWSYLRRGETSVVVLLSREPSDDAAGVAQVFSRRRTTEFGEQNVGPDLHWQRGWPLFCALRPVEQAPYGDDRFKWVDRTRLRCPPCDSPCWEATESKCCRRKSRVFMSPARAKT